MVIKCLDTYLHNLRVKKPKLQTRKRKRSQSQLKSKNKDKLNNNSNPKKLKTIFHNGVKILLKVIVNNKYENNNFFMNSLSIINP